MVRDGNLSGGENLDQRDFALAGLQRFLLRAVGLPGVEVDKFDSNGEATIRTLKLLLICLSDFVPLAWCKQAACAFRMVIVGRVSTKVAEQRGHIWEGEGDEVPVYYWQREFEALQEVSAFLDVGEGGDVGSGSKPGTMEGVPEFMERGAAEGGGEKEAIGCQRVEVLVQSGCGVGEGCQGEVGEDEIVALARLGGGLGVGIEVLGGAEILADVEDVGERSFGVGEAFGEAAGGFFEEGGARIGAGLNSGKVIGGEGEFGHAGDHAQVVGIWQGVGGYDFTANLLGLRGGIAFGRASGVLSGLLCQAAVVGQDRCCSSGFA